jgi:hypothetical protein
MQRNYGVDMDFSDQTVEDSLNEIWDDTYEVVAAGADAPSSESVAQFATEMGVVFPSEYVAFSASELGGLHIVVNEELWPAPAQYQVGPAWTFHRGLYFHGISAGIPEWMDQRAATEQIRADRPEFDEHHLVPFMKIYADPGVWCFTSRGTMVRVSSDADEVEEIDQTFQQLVHEELQALEERKAAYLART